MTALLVHLLVTRLAAWLITACDFFWIFQHRKIAGRESRGCCAQLLGVCLLHGRP
jgi:hypothetical protein